MSRERRQNFRGARALVAHPGDANRAMLARTLRQLGLDVLETDSVGHEPPAECDIVFFDADREIRAAPEAAGSGGPALVALIGVEAPSRLMGVVRRRCAGYLIKPVRASGVYTALVIAMNEHMARRREAEERAALAARVAGRRHVTKAVLRVMAEEYVDDDEAFRRLRRESMRRRIPIEVLARERLGEDHAEDELRRGRAP